ncbi:unnamed protein product [Candida verbasci]|uniref:Chromatin structure-remodeling complex subunit SFH1 n=1 Tax=Candida verbasci TaxID=1227364 RepID=A0A9W4TU36_9ASCO|nr:unnamed protein product [Candida verbasci]
MSLTYEPSKIQVQALATSISKRLLNDSDSGLLVNIAPIGRQAKRHAQQINYSEDFIDDFEFEDSPSATFGNKNISEEKKNQIESQKYSLARNTKEIPQLEDENLFKNLKNEKDVLIPIKLNLENNSSHKLVDFFMWNLTNPIITPTQFAEILVNDLELPTQMITQITESIQNQIEEYKYVSNLNFPNNNSCNVIIDLQFNLNNQLFEDKFELNLNQNEITPELFADIVVSDLGLSLEFKTAIAHSLHEIIIKVKKEILEGSFNNEVHNFHFNKGIKISNCLRIFTEVSVSNGNDHWEPIIEILSAAEIEKRDAERIRNQRRLKRENNKNFEETGRRGRPRKYVD